MLIPDSWRTYGGDARAVLRDFDFAKKNVEDFTTDLLDKIRVGDNVFRYLYSRKPGQLLEGFDNTYKVVPLGYEGRGGKELYHTPNGPIRLPQGYEYIGSFDGEENYYNKYGPGIDRESLYWNGRPMRSYAIIQESDDTKPKKVSKNPIDFSPRYIKSKAYYEPTPKKQVSSQSFDQLLASKNQNATTDADIKRALNLS